jgi:hypothetical protein
MHISIKNITIVIYFISIMLYVIAGAEVPAPLLDASKILSKYAVVGSGSRIMLVKTSCAQDHRF